MNVYWTTADGTSTRKRNVRLAKPAQHWPEHQNRRSHGFHQLIGSFELIDRTGIHFDAHIFIDGYPYSHAAQERQHCRDVIQVRKITDVHRPISQQGGRQNRQT